MMYDKYDARKLSPVEQHECRRQVIRAYKRGYNKRRIALEVGLSYSATCNIINRFEAGGFEALVPRKRGRRRGEKRALDGHQEARLRALICDHRPEQLKMEFALWSRITVREWIQREYGLELHIRTVGKLLARWGFTPPKPIRRAYEQLPATVRSWLDTEYPSIVERARSEGAEIHWGNETELVNKDVCGCRYAPRSKMLITQGAGDTRQKLSMISTITNQGKARWMIIDGALNHEKLIEFFRVLIKDTKRKVFLIQDNLGVHHCKPVKIWQAKHQEQIEVFCLPSCLGIQSGSE